MIHHRPPYSTTSSPKLRVLPGAELLFFRNLAIHLFELARAGRPSPLQGVRPLAFILEKLNDQTAKTTTSPTQPDHPEQRTRNQEQRTLFFNRFPASQFFSVNYPFAAQRFRAIFPPYRHDYCSFFLELWGSIGESAPALGPPKSPCRESRGSVLFLRDSPPGAVVSTKGGSVSEWLIFKASAPFIR